MDKIKFRVWLKREKIMVRVMEINFPEHYIAAHDERGGFYSKRGLGCVIMMQFTGLKDKKGKEIFEGDIFESRASENKADWKRWVCVYQDGSFCFETEIGKRKKKIEQNMLCDDEIKLYGLVVIGNIYENPKLMEEINNE